MGRQVCSIPFGSCTTNARLGCFPDGHLAGHRPFLSGVCGPVRFRCSRQIHCGKWRTSPPAPRLFGSTASASRLANGVRDIPWGDADLRCAEHQAEICVLSAPDRDRSRRVICGWGRIRSAGASWVCPRVIQIGIRLAFSGRDPGKAQKAISNSLAYYPDAWGNAGGGQVSPLRRTHRKLSIASYTTQMCRDTTPSLVTHLGIEVKFLFRRNRQHLQSKPASPLSDQRTA